MNNEIVLFKPDLNSFAEEAGATVYLLRSLKLYPGQPKAEAIISCSCRNKEKILMRYEYSAGLTYEGQSPEEANETETNVQAQLESIKAYLEKSGKKVKPGALSFISDPVYGLPYRMEVQS